MVLGELKGMSLAFPDEKNNFYNDLLKKEFVEEVFDYGNIGFCLKVKNPVYSYCWIYGGLIHPIISRFCSPKDNDKESRHIDGAVFVVPIVRKYFHDVLETMPLILTLKEKHKDFKVILNSHERAQEQVFNSFNLSPAEASPQNGESLKYWIDFLTTFNIDFECIQVQGTDEKIKFSADYGYIFYYSDYGLGMDQSDYSHNTTGLKGNVRIFNGKDDNCSIIICSW